MFARIKLGISDMLYKIITFSQQRSHLFTEQKSTDGLVTPIIYKDLPNGYLSQEPLGFNSTKS